MNKIDLIIDALELAIRETQHPSLCIDKFDEALAAARELKALQPVAYVGGLNGFEAMRLVTEGWLMYTPLYALDEVKHD